MKELGKLLLYFVAVIVAGALLAPPLYWAGRGLVSHGVARFLEDAEFQQYFNRAVLITALALLWPWSRWLEVKSWAGLGLERDERAWRRLSAGFIISGLCVALLATGYVLGGVYRWKTELPWGKVPPLLLSAVVVAVIEEGLFRAGILGLFRRSMRPWTAVAFSSAIFAAVHFLKPSEDAPVTVVRWSSGLELIPHVFHQFAEPLMVMGGLTTIFVLGLLLADVTVQTRSLWMPMGLHAGVVFVKMSFSKLTKRESASLPWIGEELQIGLVPIAALLLAWGGSRLWLRYENRGSRG